MYTQFDSATFAYAELPASFATALSTVTSFAFTCWVKIESVGGNFEYTSTVHPILDM
jgi:hypothetical protein